MNPFKVGDLVNCIDNDSGFFKKIPPNKCFKVIEVNRDYVNIKDDDGEVQEGWKFSRFELVKEVKECSTPIQKNERAVSDWGF